jgi:WXXGXW repeat (2 copies)
MRNAVVRSIFAALLLMAIGIAMAPAASAQVGVSITIAPPALPVYEQPICPGDGYIWTPGYWAWNDGCYFWVPGTWILAPEVGYLWTPPWWGWGGGVYVFHAGYWGPHIGFYGGVNYGFGYFGNGFEGGRWDGGHFFYNRSVTNVNVTVIHNTYNTTVINRNESRVSYNGGNGGINARASAEEERYANERHVGPVAAQNQHFDAARANPQFRASENHGKPPVAATARPGEFNGHEAVPAREAGGEYHAPEEHGAANNTAARPTPTHAKEVTPATRSPYNPSGNAKVDTKYQQQQEKLSQKQEQERTKLQSQQEKEDQHNQQRNVAQERQQATEKQHAQQAQQMQERHQTEQTHFEQSHAAPPSHSNGGGKPK